ncbi:SIS domain-containing protein [Candidatus Omnitrophota bacterium]
MNVDAKKVLEIEAKAIQDLIKRIDENFDKAINIILECSGRVIVTGMGKPGFIAGKIAATLASTGTPSLSIHPADAIHGDLGMVTADDVVIAISNSGETEEVVRLLSTLKKIGAKLISMTGNTDSTLAQYSDVVLDVSVYKEACPLGLAPTTSTTAALAMGDAIAVVLIKKRNFEHKDFAFYHPGGSLGKKLLKVKDIMRQDERNPIVDENATVKQALLAITKAKAGCCAIVDSKGILKGIFTDGDLRRHLEEEKSGDFVHERISECMTENPLVVDEEQLAAEAFRLLHEKKIDELVVINRKREVIGLLDVQDLLNAGFV